MYKINNLIESSVTLFFFSFTGVLIISAVAKGVRLKPLDQFYTFFVEVSIQVNCYGLQWKLLGFQYFVSK